MQCGRCGGEGITSLDRLDPGVRRTWLRCVPGGGGAAACARCLGGLGTVILANPDADGGDGGVEWG
eukprot:gene30407-33518_t